MGKHYLENFVSPCVISTAIKRSKFCLLWHDKVYDFRPSNATVDGDKVTDSTVPSVGTEQQGIDEQTAEKVGPLFSQPATIIPIETEACTHEV